MRPAPAFGWTAGDVVALLKRNAAGQAQKLAESDIVAAALRAVLGDTTRYSSTVGALYAAAKATLDEDEKRSPGWPKQERFFGEQLRRLAPALRAVGLAISFRQKDGRTWVDIEHKGVSATSATSPTSPAHNPSNLNGLSQVAEVADTSAAKWPKWPKVAEVADDPLCSYRSALPAWNDDRAWNGALGKAGGVEAKRRLLAEWAAAAGGGVEDGAMILPAGLPPGLAAIELRRWAGQLGLRCEVLP